MVSINSNIKMRYSECIKTKKLISTYLTTNIIYINMQKLVTFLLHVFI